MTGSRIRGVAPVGSNVVSLGRQQFEETSAGSITEVLKQVPQISAIGISPEAGRTPAGIVNTQRASAIDLRGLGPDGTLPLFDGRRLVKNGVTAAYTDPNSLPTAFISRIEVVPDGASAIYGSTAIVGVVNLVPRKRFDGFEVSGKVGFADGYTSQKYGAIGGLNWDGGNLVAAYEYNTNDPLPGRARANFRQDQTSRGGGDYRVTTCNPGNLIIGGVRYAIPASGPVTPETLRPGINKCDSLAPTDILAREERHSIALFAQQQLTDDIDVFVEAFAVRRKTKTPQVASGSQLLLFSATLPRTNAFFVNPAGASTTAPVTLEYFFNERDYPNLLTQYGRNQLAQIVGGVNVRLPYDWKAELSGVFGRTKEEYANNNLNNTARAAAYASSDRLTAFNPFGPTNPDTLAAIKTGIFAPWAWNDLVQTALRADGPLMELPGGTLRAAVGLEYTRDRLKGGATRGTLTVPDLGVITRTKQSARTAYGELLVPIFGTANAVPGFHALSLSLAGRIDKYNDVGTTTNPKIGFNWEPVESIVVRGSYGTSFRAVAGINDPVQVIAAGIYPLTLQDPLSPSGTSTGIQVRGGNPDITPESAKTYSLGVEFKPASIPLRASLTYWKIDWTDRISSIRPSPVVQPLVQPEYAFLVTRNPTQAQIDAILNSSLPRAGAIPPTISFIVDSRFLNLGTLNTEGFDAQVSYLFPETSIGTFDLAAFAAITTKYKTEIGPGSGLIDQHNEIGTPPAFRGRAQLGLSTGPWRLLAAANYYNAYDNTTVTPTQRVDSHTTIDAHIGYTFDGDDTYTEGLTVALDVSNLFDKAPPFVDIAGGYDPGAASIIGRYATVSVTKQF